MPILLFQTVTSKNTYKLLTVHPAPSMASALSDLQPYPGMLFPGSCLMFQTCLLCGPLPARSALPSATWLLPTCALTLPMFCLLWKLSLTGLDPQNTLVVVVSQHPLHYM